MTITKKVVIMTGMNNDFSRYTGAMTIDKAAEMAAAIGAPVRIEILRMLIQAGKAGLSVGEIQSALDIPRSTVSHHLQKLIASGLLYQERQGTTLFCLPDFEAMKKLIAFLSSECCER